MFPVHNRPNWGVPLLLACVNSTLVSGCALPQRVTRASASECAAKTGASSPVGRMFNEAYMQCLREKSDILVAEERERADAKAERLAREYVHSLEAECQNFGFSAGTPEMSSCKMQLYQLKKAQDAQVTQQNAFHARCRAIYSSRLLAPTNSGSSGESFTSAANAYNNCMAGLSTPMPTQNNYYCSRAGNGTVFCQER